MDEIVERLRIVKSGIALKDSGAIKQQTELLSTITDNEAIALITRYLEDKNFQQAHILIELYLERHSRTSAIETNHSIGSKTGLEDTTSSIDLSSEEEERGSMVDAFVKLGSSNPRNFLKFVFSTYPMDEEYLNKLLYLGKDMGIADQENIQIVFRYLSKNSSFSFNSEVIAKHQEQWDWVELSRNSALPISEELIDRFIDSWDWSYLSINRNVGFNNNILGKYIEKWNHKWLPSNDRLLFTPEIISEYHEHLDFWALSERGKVCMTKDLLEKNSEYGWHWSKLTLNESITLTEPLIDKMIECWRDFDEDIPLYWSNLSGNKSVRFTESLLLKYINHWDIDCLIRNPSAELTEFVLSRIPRLSQCKEFEFNEYMLNKYSDKLDWRVLSLSKSIIFDEKILARFSDNWYWDVLSRNSSINFSETLLDRFYDKWDWDKISYFSGVELTEILLDKYSDKWDWSIISQKLNFRSNEDLLDRFHDKWDWKAISKNPSLQFTEEILTKFSNRLDWTEISRHANVDFTKLLLNKFIRKWNISKLVGQYDVFLHQYLMELYVHSYVDIFEELGHTSISKIALKEIQDDGTLKIQLKESGESLFEYYYKKINEVGFDTGCVASDPVMGMKGLEKVIFSEEFIGSTIGKFRWEHYLGSGVLPLSEDLIDKYIDQWNWRGLSRNKQWPFTIASIDKYKKHWDWKALVDNPSFPLTDSIVAKFSGYLDLDGLLWKSRIEITDEKLYKFASDWDLSSLEQSYPRIKTILCELSQDDLEYVFSQVLTYSDPIRTQKIL